MWGFWELGAPHPHTQVRMPPDPDMITLLLTPGLNGFAISIFQPQITLFRVSRRGQALAMAFPGLAQHANRVQ